MHESSASRIAFLRERVSAAKAAGGPTAPVPFRQEQIHLPQFQVPIAFPLYRLQNGRTHRAQASYIEQHELPDDFFADPEDEKAQEAQGEILRAMVDQAGLREDLEEREQRAPLVLTSDGFIVDGNRRTAALRAEGKVEHVMAVVLPEDALAPDLYETELELQMARDTKAEYNWVDEALHIRWGVKDLAEPIASIARRMSITEKDVEELLGRLSLVDVYLEWLGAPGKYHRVPTGDRSDAEQSFIELHQRERRPRFRTLPEPQRRAVLQACFVVIKENGGYQDVRRVADSLISSPAKVVSRLKDELPPELSARLDAPAIADDTTDDATGPLGILDQLATVDQPVEAPPGSEILNLLEDPGEAPQVAPAITQVAEDLAALDKESKQLGQPLRNVERALRTLQDLALTSTTPQLDDIATTLGQIVSRADELALIIEELKDQ